MPESGKTALVVDPDSATRAQMIAAVREVGYVVNAAEDFRSGRRILVANPPDLLMTELRLGPFNGLHLVLLGPFYHAEMAAIVATAVPDPYLETEAQRQGALFLVKPFDPHELRRLLERLGTVPRRRRAHRRIVEGGFAVDLGDRTGTVMDVSYSGLRLEVAMPAGAPPPPAVDLMKVHIFDLPIWVRRVWTVPAATSTGLVCGVALADERPPVVEKWRRFVDALA